MTNTNYEKEDYEIKPMNLLKKIGSLLFFFKCIWKI